MTPTECIRAARELLADPVRHARGALARSADGSHRVSRSPNAVAWCLRGALAKLATFDDVFFGALELCRRAAQRLHGDAWRRSHACPLLYVNDQLSHQAVLEILDAAQLFGGAA